MTEPYGSLGKDDICEEEENDDDNPPSSPLLI